MSSPRLLILARSSPEVPPHALAARFEHLKSDGWDVRLEREPRPRRTSRWLRGGRDRRFARVDIVHFTSGPTAVEDIGAAHRTGARVLVTFAAEDLAAGGLAEPGYYDEVWREAAAVHLSDGRVWQRALARGCPEGMPHTVIGPAPDPRFLAPVDRAAESGPLALLSVGPLRWSQGYEHALHAMRLVRDRGVDCTYRIAGTGDYATAVAFARHQFGLEEHVELVEPVTPDELRAEYADADVFVCAAVVEGTPQALLDAQATGLPAVVSDAGRNPDFLDGSGLVVRRRDPHALADALAQLATDGELRRRMGRRSRERAAALRAHERFAEFEALYRSLA